jgi:hypothetical protein
VVAAKKLDKASVGIVDSLPQATVGMRWSWPSATLVIIVLSLLLWGGIAAIALFAFN